MMITLIILLILISHDITYSFLTPLQSRSIDLMSLGEIKSTDLLASCVKTPKSTFLRSLTSSESVTLGMNSTTPSTSLTPRFQSLPPSPFDISDDELTNQLREMRDGLTSTSGIWEQLERRVPENFKGESRRSVATTDDKKRIVVHMMEIYPMLSISMICDLHYGDKRSD